MVSLLRLEPTLPARPHHHTHPVGHLHRPNPFFRLAFVDRLTVSTTGGLEAARGPQRYSRERAAAGGRVPRLA